MQELEFCGWIRDGDWNEDGEKRNFTMISSDALAFSEFEPLVDLMKDIPDHSYMLQYTGIKDIKGEKIFKGWILKDEHGNVGVVLWRNLRGYPCFCVEWEDGDITGFEDSAHLDYTVIGNIFEKPELVKYFYVPEQN